MAVLFQKKVSAPDGAVNIKVNNNSYTVPDEGTVSVTDADAVDLRQHPLVEAVGTPVGSLAGFEDTIPVTRAVDDLWTWGPSTVNSGLNRRHPTERLADLLNLEPDKLHQLGVSASSLVGWTTRWQDWDPGSGGTPGSESIGFNSGAAVNAGISKMAQDFLGMTYNTSISGPGSHGNDITSRFGLGVLQFGIAEYAQHGTSDAMRNSFKNALQTAISLLRCGPYYDAANGAWAYTGTASTAASTQVANRGIGNNCRIGATGSIMTYTTPANFEGGDVYIFFSHINDAGANAGAQIAWSVDGGTATNDDYRSGHLGTGNYTANLPAADSFRHNLFEVKKFTVGSGAHTIRATLSNASSFGWTLYGAGLAAKYPPFLLIEAANYIANEDFFPVRGEGGGNLTSAYSTEADNDLVDAVDTDLQEVVGRFDQYVKFDNALRVGHGDPPPADLVLSDTVHQTDWASSRVAAGMFKALEETLIPLDYAAWIAGNSS